MRGGVFNVLQVIPRAMRVEYPGAIYHVMDRGDRREDIFVDDVDRIWAEELARRGWTEADLAARQGSDRGKVAIAVRWRSETTLPVKWIAARVQIGTAKGAKSLLHHLAPGPRHRKCTRMNQAYAQLEFRSTVCGAKTPRPTPGIPHFACRTPETGPRGTRK